MTLQDTPLRSLSEVERKVLCRVAVAKLQALNLGVHIRPPTGEYYTRSVTVCLFIVLCRERSDVVVWGKAKG